MTDLDLVKKKLAFIETCVSQLRRLAHPELIESDVREQRFVEDSLQVAIQAMVDTASHIVSDDRLGEATTNHELFDLLAGAGYIDERLRLTLRKMVGFRDLVVHGYASIDLAIVRDVLEHHLDDLLAFVTAIHLSQPCVKTFSDDAADLSAPTMISLTPMQHAHRLFAACALAASGALVFACGGDKAASSGPAVATTATTSDPVPTAMPSATEAASAMPEATASASVAPLPAGPPLAIAAMKLTMPKSKPFELKGDGSVLYDGQALGKFVGADFVDKDGKVVMTVAADGSLTSPVPGAKPAKFNDKDELEIGGGVLSVSDDGSVKMIRPDGKPDKDSGKAKFTGFKTNARRAATVLLVLILARSNPTVTMSGASGSAVPAPTPLPAK